ncbi:MAG: class I SAM-dependent methyltransferase [Thiomargarita sp.]|nr:class I SAM-dependent methyltransferase [Thiomargarita sp.]
MENILTSLNNFIPPDNWKGHIFLLPQDAMRYLYQFIVDNKLQACIELGTGFGATSCMMGAAVKELNQGKVITIDKYLHHPVNVKVLMRHVGLSDESIEVVADELGYNWFLAELIREQTHDGVCLPIFDFCLLDGAHEWEPDALAFSLMAKLLKPGGWIAIDDINFFLRMIPNWQESHGTYTDKELDTFQMRMVYELVVQQHPDFGDFHLTHDGRIGWARKKHPAETKKSLVNRIKSSILKR